MTVNTVSGQNELSYLGVRASNPPNQIVASRAPVSTAGGDYQFAVGTLWVDQVGLAAYELVNVLGTTGTWVGLGGGASDINTINLNAPIAGNYTLAGTANQISKAETAGTTTFSIPVAFIAPGSIASTTTLTGGTGITATTGNIVASTGNITSTLGSMSAATTVTAGTGITATTGNIVASTGNITSTLGSMSAATTVTAGTGITATTGNIVASTGNITSTLGSVAAATTVTGGTGVTATTGNVTATAGAVNAGTSMTATAGDITATLGNVIINGAAKQLRVHGGAATDFIGQTTLALGVSPAIANTNIAATDKIFLSRQGVNGSTALGVFDVVITPTTSFQITARKPADASTETGDTSIVDYFIVRQV